MFNVVNDRAVAYVRKHGAKRIVGVDDVTREAIANLIADGLQQNIGMAAITQRIAKTFLFSEDQAKLIAGDEIARANGMSSLEGMKLCAAGVKLKKVWLADAESCEICKENASVGGIDLDDQFPKRRFSAAITFKMRMRNYIADRKES